MTNAVANPLHLQLCSKGHREKDTRGARAMDHEEIWEPGHVDPKISGEAIFPFLLQ